MRPDIAVPSGGNTTHFSVVDEAGNVVANTYSLNFNYGLGFVADGTGILLNNELDDFAAKPGAPNAFGLIGGAANAPGPGKRPLSSMTPTIVFKDTKPVLVTGAPGGSRIITTVLQVIVNAIDGHMTIGNAVAAPRAASPMVAGRSRGRAEFSARQDPGAHRDGPQGAGRPAVRLGAFDRRHAGRAYRRGRSARARRVGRRLLSPSGVLVQDTTRRDSNMRASRRRASLLRVRLTVTLIEMPPS